MTTLYIIGLPECLSHNLYFSQRNITVSTEIKIVTQYMYMYSSMMIYMYTSMMIYMYTSMMIYM